MDVITKLMRFGMDDISMICSLTYTMKRLQYSSIHVASQNGCCLDIGFSKMSKCAGGGGGAGYSGGAGAHDGAAPAYSGSSFLAASVSGICTGLNGNTGNGYVTVQLQ